MHACVQISVMMIPVINLMMLVIAIRSAVMVIMAIKKFGFDFCYPGKVETAS